jgi:histidinol-phosphate aminotransferase
MAAPRIAGYLVDHHPGEQPKGGSAGMTSREAGGHGHKTRRWHSERERGRARLSFDLSHHGDADIVPGLVDLAVNVRAGGTPDWLAARIRATDLAAYPDRRAALAAVTARHGRAEGEALLTAGAAEAFVLLARALRPRHAVVVYPQFTEPEAALRAAGHAVDRVILPFPFALDPALVPADADLVFVGNPTNPTSVAHHRDELLGLVRPGRIVVVDEAFADCLPGERQSLAGHRDLTGLVVLRSLTKTWGLAGLRVGYLLAAPGVVRLLASAQPLWSVSTPALEACVATASPAALAEALAWAQELAAERTYLLSRLADAAGMRVVPGAEASFVLIDTGIGDIRARLLDRGFAVRRGETFPGLGPGWIRVAVRDTTTAANFAAALADASAEPTGGRQPVVKQTACSAQCRRVPRAEPDCPGQRAVPE